MGGSKARDVKENIIMLCPTHHREAHGAATGEGEAQSLRDGSGSEEKSQPSLPSPAGASQPEERVGRGSQERGPETVFRLSTPSGAQPQSRAVTPPDSLASSDGEEATPELEASDLKLARTGWNPAVSSPPSLEALRAALREAEDTRRIQDDALLKVNKAWREQWERAEALAASLHSMLANSTEHADGRITVERYSVVRARRALAGEPEREASRED